MSTCCQVDDRRDAVRRLQGWNGLDYVEVSKDQLTLHVYFLGKLPPELRQDGPGIERYLQLEGGERITDVHIVDVDPVVDPDPEADDYLLVRLDKYGDYSTYTLRLVGVESIDPRHDHVDFSFKIECGSDLDCAPASTCEPTMPAEPEINYLAKDYASFRQLILDRLSLLIPDWKERHASDLGIALVELLAYAGDYLSYYQDAVGTEAYLDTARERISVRRHVRLVDYVLHEGCNARAWVCLEVSSDLPLDPADAAFITGLNDLLPSPQGVLSWGDVRGIAPQAYEIFEPLVTDRTTPVQLRAAHSTILFYTWGQRECCLERGSTSATLLDALLTDDETSGEGVRAATRARRRALQLEPGDVLIFEEVLGPKTGLTADADPRRRHAVRLTRVTPREDVVIRTADGAPTPYVDVEWAADDALPFPFCISAIGSAPECRYLENISVARGNVILVDHGTTVELEELGEVSMLGADTVCECADHPGDIRVTPDRFRTSLKKTPLTFGEPLPADNPARRRWVPAARFLTQNARAALPHVQLTSQLVETWHARYDLLASLPGDRHFVVEVDNVGVAQLRFGDGELGYQPPAGMRFKATYRVGNGARGNVGAESISRLLLRHTVSGVAVTVRNPLAARGGTEPEPIAEAKLFAPRAFRKRIERAIIAADYETIAERNAKLQNASAELVWTGSWYEADVAIDPLGREASGKALLRELTGYLHRFRRMGHDLRVVAARSVPLDLQLHVCVLPHFQRGHVKAALLDLFSNRILTGGTRGFFHPDSLTFGEGIYLSKIVATAQAVPGVESVMVTGFHRSYAAANHEIENGVLPLQSDEIAQLDNDPNHPEHGKLEILVDGGR